jgi:hypothetical protein
LRAERAANVIFFDLHRNVAEHQLGAQVFHGFANNSEIVGGAIEIGTAGPDGEVNLHGFVIVLMAGIMGELGISIAMLVLEMSEVGPALLARLRLDLNPSIA